MYIATIVLGAAAVIQPNISFKPHHAGLQLKRETKSCSSQSFSYALLTGTKQSLPVRWQYVVARDDPETMEGNIRLLELVDGQDLPHLLEGFTRQNTKAVVLANTKDNYEVAVEFVAAIRKGLPFPVLVVKRADGEEILRRLKCHTGEKILARVYAENQTDKEHGDLDIDQARAGQVPPQSVDHMHMAEQQSGIRGELYSCEGHMHA